jgi:hypothetical protein
MSLVAGHDTEIERVVGHCDGFVVVEKQEPTAAAIARKALTARNAPPIVREREGPAARVAPAAMRVRVSDEEYLGDLIAFLERAGYLVEAVAEDELIASPVPRSVRLEQLRLDLDLHLQLWAADHPDITARQVLV